MAGPIYLQGLVLGLAAAVPIGPVNIEIIRCGLSRGFVAAFSLGLGACTADMAYLSLILLGMAAWAQDALFLSVLQLAGGIFLVFLGALTAWTARRAARKAVDEMANQREGISASIPMSFFTGLGMTLTNPMTIAFWASSSTQLTSQTFAWGSYLASLAGVATGTIGWVALVGLLCTWGRKFVGRRVLLAVNLAGAAMLGGYGLLALLKALG